MGTSRRQRASREGTFLESVKSILQDLKSDIAHVNRAIDEIKAVSVTRSSYYDFKCSSNHSHIFDCCGDTWGTDEYQASCWNTWANVGFEQYEGHQPVPSSFAGVVEPELDSGMNILPKEKFLAHRRVLQTSSVPDELSGLRVASWNGPSAVNAVKADCKWTQFPSIGTWLKVQVQHQDTTEDLLHWRAGSKKFIRRGSRTEYEISTEAACRIQSFYRFWIRRRSDRTELAHAGPSHCIPAAIAHNVDPRDPMHFWSMVPLEERLVPEGIGELAFKETHTDVTRRVIRRLAECGRAGKSDITARMAALVMNQVWTQHGLAKVPRTRESWEAITTMMADDVYTASTKLFDRLAEEP